MICSYVPNKFAFRRGGSATQCNIITSQHHTTKYEIKFSRKEMNIMRRTTRNFGNDLVCQTEHLQYHEHSDETRHLVQKTTCDRFSNHMRPTQKALKLLKALQICFPQMHMRFIIRIACVAERVKIWTFHHSEVIGSDLSQGWGCVHGMIMRYLPHEA